MDFFFFILLLLMLALFGYIQLQKNTFKIPGKLTGDDEEFEVRR